MGINYITKGQIRNLVEYCLDDVLDKHNRKDDMRMRELITRFDIEFKKAKEYYRKAYKEK